MGLARRSFIKFAVGAVVGIHVTPIPWKLMDDVAIWTQNWPWVPDPKGGAISYRNISGGLTDCGCGLRVRLVNDKRAVLLAGNPDHPLSKGGLCPMCAASLQYIYNTDVRLTTPMMKTGGSWLEISWDEAMKMLTGKLADLRKSETPEKAAMVTGNLNTATTAVFRRFMEAYGSPNVLSMPSMRNTNEFVAKAMFGVDGGLGYDLAGSDFVLSFGSGIAEGWGADVYAMAAYEKLLENPDAKLVQVESNLSNTADKANEWVPIAPGADAALALGLAHVIIKENLYDQSAVSQLYGFEDGESTEGKSFTGFKNLVLKDYDPKKVAQITTVPEQKIMDLARSFAKAKKPVAVAGKGKGAMPGNSFEFMAVVSLNALVGAVNRQGGMGAVPNPALADWPETAKDDVASKGLDSKMVGDGTLNGFAAAIKGAKTSPIDVLLIDGSNPAYVTPDTAQFRNTMKKIPFKVCVASFYTETVAESDLALPASTFLEKWDDLAGAAAIPFPIYQVTAPVFHPLFKSQPAGEIMLSLAKAMGGSIAESFPWKKMEDVVKSRAVGIYKSGGGMAAAPGSLGKTSGKGFSSEKDFWGNVVATGCWYDPAKAIGKGSASYGTPSGKIELCSQTAKGAIAKYQPAKLEGKESEYPLLMMPYERMWISGNELASAPFMTKVFPDTLLLGTDVFVSINPQTASDYKLSEGDWVQIKSPKGSLKARAHLFNGVRPGVVSVPEGFGHTAFDKYMRGKGVNFREIATVEYDQLSGFPMWWGTRVNLIKV